MDEYTFLIVAEGMPYPRLDDIDDLYDALVSDARMRGPALAVDEDDSIELVGTVQADSEREGARLAARVMADALRQTRRASTVAWVSTHPLGWGP
jgi:hypothetical protein